MLIKGNPPAVANIDLSTYGTDEGNKKLAQQLIEAVRTKGFFYVTNFGIPQERVDRQFALGQAFYELPLEEKLQYVPDLDNGEYNGYRPAGRRALSGGLKDKVEVWNMASEFGTSPGNDGMKHSLRTKTINSQRRSHYPTCTRTAERAY